MNLTAGPSGLRLPLYKKPKRPVMTNRNWSRSLLLMSSLNCAFDCFIQWVVYEPKEIQIRLSLWQMMLTLRMGLMDWHFTEFTVKHVNCTHVWNACTSVFLLLTVSHFEWHNVAFTTQMLQCRSDAQVRLGAAVPYLVEATTITTFSGAEPLLSWKLWRNPKYSIAEFSLETLSSRWK